jgi:maleate isomerase
MRSTAELTARLDEILAALRDVTSAARVTLRVDLPERGLHCNDVAAEARAPGVKSLIGQTALDQRAAGSIRWLDAHKRPLVQDDLSGAVEAAPPPELVSVLGVTAQMLGPVVRGDMLTGWISVHVEKRPRHWTEVDVKALEAAVERVQRELDGAR